MPPLQSQAALFDPEDRLVMTKQWRQRVLATLLLLMAAIGTHSMVVVRIHPDQAMRLLPNLIALAACVLAMVPTLRGDGRRAVLVFCGGLFVHLAAAGWLGGGLGAPSMMLVPLAALVPGWFLGLRTALSFAAASAVLIIVLWVASAAGWIAAPSAPDALRFISLTMGLLGGLALTIFALRVQHHGRLRVAGLVDELATALRAARRSEMEFKTLADTLPALVTRFDLLQDCRFANKRFLDAVHRSDALGQPLATLFSPAHVEQLRAMFLRACEGETSIVDLFRATRPGGAPTCHEVSVFLERDESDVALGYLVLAYDVSARERARAELVQAALHDPLTGLPNRLVAEDRLRQATARARRGGHGFAVLALDLDGFKPINDQYGHAAGDAMLRHLATQLTTSLRAADTVARIGGDEFLIVADTLSSGADAAHLAAKLLDAARRPLNHGATDLRVSASIGIAHYPADGTTPEQLQAAADRALYAAKRAGRDRWAAASVAPD